MNLEFYKHEEGRIMSSLLMRAPGTEEYQSLLRDYHDLIFTAVQSLDAIERLSYAEETEASDAPLNIVELKPAEPEPEPPETEVAEPAVTFDEIKSRLTVAARSGVDVGKIINDLGYAKLSDVPPGEYGDLLNALTEAT